MRQESSRVTPVKYYEHAPGTSEEQGRREYPRNLVAHREGRRLVRPVSEIDYLTAAANYVHVCSAGQVLRIRTTIKAIEEHLDPQKFGRVHRCTIVNFDRVKEFRKLGRGDHMLILNDGTQLKMSRRHRGELGKIVGLAHATGTASAEIPSQR